MFNRKIFLSGLSILSALSLMGGATFAFFSSNASSTGNVFAAGTLHLALCDGNEPCPSPTSNSEQSVSASFGLAGMKPGDCTGVQDLSLENTGSVAGGSVDVAANNDNGTLAPYLRINSLTFDGGAQSVGNPNGNGWSDLDDFQTSSLNGLPGIAAGGTKILAMDVCLDQSAPNAVQGMSDTFTLSVTLKQ